MQEDRQASEDRDEEDGEDEEWAVAMEGPVRFTDLDRSPIEQCI